ncbi:MAG: Acetylaminoadipate kinase [uncultured Thermomicrobiales bacterium]|uniref:Acetylglutamate kinase n=1 Tax=uncultured Thermomicrobiales bacterium TaxID=1645740 RepID=A0A6J4U2J8_9BACT|nr:MAG: Acetylaminoadipate kinase [uncultured Thermomicrobiales bacterium]
MTGRTLLVIKIGGGAAIDHAAYAHFATDLASMGEPAVIVHGGNAEFSRLSAALGMPPRMITSASGRVTRYTDRATMDAMLMAYCGKVNKTVVGAFQAAGLNAVGLSGMDGRVAAGRRKPMLRGTEDGKPKVLRDDHAGTIETLDPRLVRLLLDADYVPVLTPPALGEDGVPINVDGDKLALALATELGAAALLFFSDTPGLLRDVRDETTLIREIDAADPASALAAADGRMVVKVEAALGAIARGVGRVVFADARVERPVSRALAGEGTVVRG